MSTVTEITYEPYNKNSLIVHGADKLEHRTVFRSIDGRWNSRLRQGPAWLIPRHEEKRLIQVINQLNKQHELVEMKSNAKSRKEQHKYHRAVSESEYSSDATNHSANDADEQPRISRTEMDKYYRAFKKTPDTFKTPEYVYEQQGSSHSYSGSSNHSDAKPLSRVDHGDTDDASLSEFSEQDEFPEPDHDYNKYKPSPSPSLSPPPVHTQQSQKPRQTYVRESEKHVSRKQPLRTAEPRPSRDYTSSTSSHKHRRLSRDKEVEKEYSSAPKHQDTKRGQRHNTHSSHRYQDDSHPYSRREKEYCAPPKRTKEVSHHHRRYRHYVSSDDSESSDVVDSRELRKLQEQMQEIQSRISKAVSSSSSRKTRRHR